MTPNDQGRAKFGPFEVDLHTRELWKFGTRLKLVGQPFEILAVLLRRPGELVTREELRTRLWPADTFVDFNHGLNAAVNKLRDALSDSADAPRYVETLPRRGYRFIAAIEWLSEDCPPGGSPSALSSGSSLAGTGVARPAEMAAPAVTTKETSAQPHPAPIPVPVSNGEKTGRKVWLRLMTGAAVLIFAVGVGVVWLLSAGESTFATRPTSEHSRLLTSIAGTSSPAFSADGNFVAFTRNSTGGIFVSEVGQDHPMQLTSNQGDGSPVWSPDGKFIAFSRYENRQYSIYLVPVDGGTQRKQEAEAQAIARPAAFTIEGRGSAGERRIDTGDAVPNHGEIDWSPDGRSIAFSTQAGICLVSLQNTHLHLLTNAPAQSEDWGPAFSPDGRQLLFVRRKGAAQPEEIWVASMSSGKVTRLLTEPGKIVSTPQWSFDGKSLIFASNRNGGHPALWRASLDNPGSVFQIGEAGSPAWDPAISRRGYRLAYERITKSLSVWEVNLMSPDKRPHILVPSTSDTDQGPGPQFSPDGRKLAFMSDRSGTMEIWVSNRDGSNAFQLSAVGGAGTPRWSPDSQSLAFDVNTSNGAKIVTMDLRGGAPTILTQDSFHSVCPSWSHDGKWIYFASTRSGEWQVWKIPTSGGTPVQVTHHGGHAPIEAVDGKTLYYAKNAQPEPEVWQIPAGGGEETVVPLVRPGTWASWQVVNEGILFVGPCLGHQAVISYYEFAKNRTTILTVLDRTPFWLGATPDGQTLAFDRPGQEETQAMLVENFR